MKIKNKKGIEQFEMDFGFNGEWVRLQAWLAIYCRFNGGGR